MTMTRRLSFLITLFAVLVALVHAGGTRPEDQKWLEAKAKEDGVVATGTGLLYKGTFSCLDISCYHANFAAGKEAGD